MAAVPDAYYQFIMDYAPYVYVVPESGPDMTWGRAAFATMVQNSLNISFATFLALTGVGIAVIVAAAAAMWSFANSMNSATASVQSFNEAASESPSHVRGIQRAGEAELYRRGVE